MKDRTAEEIERLHDACAEMRGRYSAKCDEIEHQAKRIAELETMLDQQALGPTLAKWQGVMAENERLRAALTRVADLAEMLRDDGVFREDEDE